MGTASDVGEGLVDRNPLHERCEIANHLDGCVAQPLVFLEMTAHKSELRTEFQCLPSPALLRGPRSGPNEDQSMKRSRFTEEQIIGILKEDEAGVPVADLC